MGNTSMKERITIDVVPLDDVIKLIRETVREEMKIALSSPKTNSESKAELYTREQTAKILKVTLVTLDNWTKLGIIKAQRIGTRIRYTRKAIGEALKDAANEGQFSLERTL